MPKNFYISDLHLGHGNVIRFDGRPFGDVAEMEQALISNWNSRVGRDDTVYILGDFINRVNSMYPSDIDNEELISLLTLIKNQGEEIESLQKELDKLLARLSEEEKTPGLLLHSCCAPCSSYVLEYLSQYFCITVFYYNPNIFPESEYTKRILEQQTLISRMRVKHPVSFIAGPYDKDLFYQMAAGLEDAKEGGARCMKCYELRLREAAEVAKAGGFDYFTTTLTISPLKNAAWLNEIGLRLAKEYGVSYLVSDFKKKNGYKRSIELSKEYGLYRQDYCGCEFSMRERERK